MKKLYFILLILSLPIVSFSQNPGKTDPEYAKKLKELYKNTVSLIQPQELANLMNESKKVIILDTRESSEFNVSHIKGAKNVGYDNFKLSNLPKSSKNDLIIVYCSVGWRSERIGEKLKKAGYTNVKNLYGGIFEWVNQGYKVYNANGPTKKVHTYSEEWAKWVK